MQKEMRGSTTGVREDGDGRGGGAGSVQKAPLQLPAPQPRRNPRRPFTPPPLLMARDRCATAAGNREEGSKLPLPSCRIPGLGAGSFSPPSLSLLIAHSGLQQQWLCRATAPRADFAHCRTILRAGRVSPRQGEEGGASKRCCAVMAAALGPVLALQAVCLLGSFVAGNHAPPVPVPSGELQVERMAVPARCPRAVRAGDFVRYHYQGSLADGSKFDSSYDRGSTYNVFVGKGQLIAGMDKALIGMCVNERRIVTVPPSLAYGSEGVPGVIPPDAVLHFDVLLMDLWNPEDKLLVETYHTPDSCSRTVQVSDFVRYHYNGTLLDGTLFDSSHIRMRTYDTYVGIGWLIPGMDKGLLGMCVGEKRFITVPPFLAYGEDGDGKDIPSQASLVFDVALVDLHNPKDAITVEKQFAPESCERVSQSGDFIRYHYNGTLLDGFLFDSSYSRNHTYDTYIGKGYVIAGMDEGLLGVCIGERRRITIPPHLGYGEEGSGKIPGSAVLVFDIHVIDFHNPSDSISIITRYKPTRCTELSKKGDYLKYHYNASLMDGTELDSTMRYGKTYNIVLGSGQVVLGMDMGLREMCVGEKRTVVIPPHLGYGEAGVDGEVPGSAVLIFDIELLDLEAGLPEGYMFIWNEEVSANLFEEIDKDKNGEVVLDEFSDYIHAQVDAGKGKLAPGFDSTKIIENMFKNQDRNNDGIMTAEEFKLKDQEPSRAHDEL